VCSMSDSKACSSANTRCVARSTDSASEVTACREAHSKHSIIGKGPDAGYVPTVCFSNAA
jgi:hypothetical protein